MRRVFIWIAVVLAVGLHGCAGAASPTLTLVAATATETISLAATATPQPTSTETAITHSPTSETPTAAQTKQVSVYYISDNQLYLQQPGGQPEALLVLPDLGQVKDALKVEESIFVIQERGLQKVSLADRSVDLVEQFPNVTINGRLLADINQEMLIYAIDQKVKLYHLRRQTTSEVLSQSEELSQPSFSVPLGLSADGTKLYLMPRGGDPEFPEVWVLTLNNGEVKPFSIGIGTVAALSPNSQYLAIASTHFVELEQPLEYKLTLFDLASPQTSGHILTLPNSPSHSRGLIWSPDSQTLYFLLRPGAPYENPTTSYGLWHFEVGSETFFQVATIENPTMHLVSLSPDGEWALLAPEREPFIMLVGTKTGEVNTIEVPTAQFQFMVVRYQVMSTP